MDRSAYEIVIGLEVHVELSTKTKIFCGCSTEFGGEPNTHVCPICMGAPGALPVLNKAVVEKAIAAGLATHCEIQKTNIFDRKNYFYPDLPKAYQISQLYEPICKNGYVVIPISNADGASDANGAGAAKKIRIHEIHMEEDAGKLVHDGTSSLVDYNRSGVPLIEIVSEPDMRSADEAVAYLETLRETLVYLGVSDCKMQEGSMRADVNLSIRPAGTSQLGTRTETKNLNSIKAIRRSIEFEAERQIALLEKGEKIVQETRRWDDAIGENYAMRNKENAQDYRYFPDPDLLPLSISAEWIEQIRASLPELASEKRTRYIDEFGLSENIAAVLTQERKIADIFEEITLALGGGKFAGIEAANAVAGEILRLLKESGTEPDALKIDADKVASVLKMVAARKINRAAGKELIEAIYKEDIDPEAYVREHGLELKTDASELEEVVGKVIAENQSGVADFQAGKEKAFGFLVGQAMRILGGGADPAAVNAELTKQLAGAASQSVSIPEKEEIIQPEINKPQKETKQIEKPIEFHTPKIATPTAPITTSARYRDLTCAELRESHVGQSIRLAGWVQTIRNHGGIVFIDLRDMFGVTQVVVTEEQLAKLGKEYAISVKGNVVKRDEETYNPAIATGAVELRAKEVEVLGPCKAGLPFEIETSRETREDLRLTYRYLDLRNPALKRNLLLRAEVIKTLRAEMESLGFVEIQTPILANSSPEGARDYLVPSRKHKGKFYALPQAPQQFKQLLMASGFDRYYQIAPCFRDEDARLDRSPGEFYQLDFEMAFATQEDVFAVCERVLFATFSRWTARELSPAPFRRIPFAESMLRYGTDKPDLRNPLIIFDLSEFFAGVDFAPFKDKTVRAIRVPGAAAQSRAFFREMEAFALDIGMKGLGYVSVQDDFSYKGPIDKFLSDEQKKTLAQIAEDEGQKLEPNDVLYFIADEPKNAALFAGQIRTEVANKLDIIDKNRFEFCFITDFPMYERNEEEGKIDFTHNPFSMPQGEMDALLNKDPLEILAQQYDVVCNGVELSSGAVRNHRPDIMLKAFEIAGYSETDVEKKFGALYRAFQYGAPPHAGMAPGVDRIVMLLAGEENIRETIAFPLNSNAQNLLMDAPSEVSELQLREAHIKIR